MVQAISPQLAADMKRLEEVRRQLAANPSLGATAMLMSEELTLKSRIERAAPKDEKKQPARMAVNVAGLTEAPSRPQTVDLGVSALEERLTGVRASIRAAEVFTPGSDIDVAVSGLSQLVGEEGALIRLVEVAQKRETEAQAAADAEYEAVLKEMDQVRAGYRTIIERIGKPFSTAPHSSQFSTVPPSAIEEKAHEAKQLQERMSDYDTVRRLLAEHPWLAAEVRAEETIRNAHNEKLRLREEEEKQSKVEYEEARERMRQRPRPAPLTQEALANKGKG